MRIPAVGRHVFAATVIALGVLGLVKGEFMPIWQPVPKDVPAREVLVYACAAVSLAAGIGLLVPRYARLAARVLLVQLAIWVLAFRARDIVHAPGTFNAWDSCAETVVILSAAWLLAGLPARVATILYALAMISFGVGHFIYPHETAALVPHSLPAPEVWTYATGSAFLLAGAAILAGVLAQLAAALSAAQMGGFTLLVWIPIVAAGAKSRFVWNELGISAALTAAAWVVADSYRARR